MFGNCANLSLTSASLLSILRDLDVLIVVSSGNDAREDGVAVSTYPALYGEPGTPWTVENMILVSASTWRGERASFAQYSDYVAAFAPADNIYLPSDPSTGSSAGMELDSGTSFGRALAGERSIR